jgi:hypothetical protein
VGKELVFIMPIDVSFAVFIFAENVRQDISGLNIIVNTGNKKVYNMDVRETVS